MPATENILHKIEDLLNQVKSFNSSKNDEIEAFRIEFLGKKGHMTDLFAEFKNVDPSEKKLFGQKVNQLKNAAQDKVNELKQVLENSTSATEYGDLTKSSTSFEVGSRHPISLIKNEIIDIFSRIGYSVSEEREIEDDWHNFTALNLPEEHPARDMQDTFFVQTNPDYMLRTHTSSVQVRYMEANKPPIRTISPGRVFRNEAISSRSHCIFHQVEGLYIDKNVSFADLKQTLLHFAKEMFGEETKIRLRPSYFPFTEPSAEMDVYWGLNSEVDYRMTKGTGWLEILGCGMVDPEVLENCGIDPNEYSGLAFGMGIERMALLKYNIPDIRMYFENDVRFLNQFQSAL